MFWQMQNVRVHLVPGLLVEASVSVLVVEEVSELLLEVAVVELSLLLLLEEEAYLPFAPILSMARRFLYQKDLRCFGLETGVARSRRGRKVFWSDIVFLRRVDGGCLEMGGV
jgi:hypothetical protein